MSYQLTFTLKSDATFGRGDGVAGLVDAEVQHDEYGLPYFGGRALKGLLVEACADLLFVLKNSARWEQAARNLFGYPGSDTDTQGWLRVGNASLPDELHAVIRNGIERKELTREQVLDSLTTIRRQTAVNVKTGAPQKETLRSMRVIVREIPFVARLDFSQLPGNDELALLSACIKAVRRIGTGRNRGRGEVAAHLLDTQNAEVTDLHFERFAQEVLS